MLRDEPHRHCNPGACEFPGFEESGGGKYITLPSGKEAFYPGCPAKHVSTSRLNEWFSSYRWLKMGKTPMELGLLSIEEMDPRWFEAMEHVDAEMNRLQGEANK